MVVNASRRRRRGPSPSPVVAIAGVVVRRGGIRDLVRQAGLDWRYSTSRERADQSSREPRQPRDELPRASLFPSLLCSPLFTFPLEYPRPLSISLSLSLFRCPSPSRAARLYVVICSFPCRSYLPPSFLSSFLIRLPSPFDSRAPRVIPSASHLPPGPSRSRTPST